MLDRDLAELYEVKPKRLREQLKRNRNRFPADFVFQLTEEETNFMVSQNATPSKKYFGGHRPYVFTEHGALMLSSILSSKRAAEMGIFVVRAFIKLRQIIAGHKELTHKLDQLERRVSGHDMDILTVFKAIRKLVIQETKPKRKIGFKPGGED